MQNPIRKPFGRPSNKPINAFLADWLIKYKYGTVYEAAIARDISTTTLDNLGDMETTHKIFAQILELAEKMDMEPAELMRGILDGKSRTPILRQEILEKVNRVAS